MRVSELRPSRTHRLILLSYYKYLCTMKFNSWDGRVNYVAQLQQTRTVCRNSNNDRTKYVVDENGVSMLWIRYVVLSCVTWSKLSSVRTRYNQATIVIQSLTALYPTSCVVLYGAPPFTVNSSIYIRSCWIPAFRIWAFKPDKLMFQGLTSDKGTREANKTIKFPALWILFMNFNWQIL